MKVEAKTCLSRVFVVCDLLLKDLLLLERLALDVVGWFVALVVSATAHREC